MVMPLFDPPIGHAPLMPGDRRLQQGNVRDHGRGHGRERGHDHGRGGGVLQTDGIS